MISFDAGRAGMRNHQLGFTYLGLLFAVAVAGIGLSVVGVVWHTERQREKEQALLFIGNEFRRAIALYYYRSPGQAHEFPDRLDDLLEDPRFPGVQRYLRRIYRDPMTGSREWGLVLTPSGRIMGVHSLSQSAVIKTEGFAELNKELSGQRIYSDWKFTMIPSPVVGKQSQ